MRRRVGKKRQNKKKKEGGILNAMSITELLILASRAD